MRTIKFRGSDSNGKWHYGNLEQGVSDNGIEMAFIAPEIPFVITAQTYIVDPATVGQFTGFDNCFGSEIYEGDILLYCNDNSKHVVVYHKGSFGINVGEQFIPLSRLYLGSDSCYRVVGNIHDNPGLLEGGGNQ